MTYEMELTAIGQRADTDITNLNTKIASLSMEISALNMAVGTKITENTALRAENAALKAENTALKTTSQPTVFDPAAWWTSAKTPSAVPPRVGLKGINPAELTDVAANAAGDCVITTVMDPATGKPWTKKRFWGKLKWTVPAEFDTIHVVGRDPNLVTAADNGCVQNYGSATTYAKFDGLLIDPLPWQTQRGKKLNPYYTGFHGGNAELKGLEIAHVHDAMNLVGPSSGTMIADQKLLVERFWLHDGLYNNNVYPPSDGQPHSDGIQTNYIRHVIFRGGLIGGTRDSKGYLTWPGGYNSGHDFWNSGMMLQWEPQTNRPELDLRDLLFEYLVVIGGTCSINWNAKGGETFPDATMRHVKIGTRGADWGATKKGTGLGTPGVVNNTGTGYMFLKSSSIVATIEDIQVLETGAPAPISKGA